jgi:hypothetical protein
MHIVDFGIGLSKWDSLAAMGILNVNEYFNCTVQWHRLNPFFHRSRNLSFYVPGLSILVPSFMTILMRFITVSVAMTMIVVPWMSPSLSSALHTDSRSVDMLSQCHCDGLGRTSNTAPSFFALYKIQNQVVAPNATAEYRKNGAGG